MRKKRILLFASLVGLSATFYAMAPKTTPLPKYCAFCDPSVLARQAFYEDDLIYALYTHRPVMPGHCLIIPKRHVERFENLTEEEITHIGIGIQKVNHAVQKVFQISSYLLLQKNGVEAGQTVPHVHVHYIPRKTGECSFFGFIFKMVLANIKPPISTIEMGEKVDSLKQAM